MTDTTKSNSDHNGFVDVILTGRNLSTKIDPLVDMILKDINDKGRTIRVRIDESDGKDVLLRDIESAIVTVDSHLGGNDVLVLDVDLPNLSSSGPVFEAWRRLISLIENRLSTGTRMILILTTMNSYLYPDEIKYKSNMLFKVDHPSKLYTEMLEPALTEDDGDVVAYDVLNCTTSRIELNAHDVTPTEDEEYEDEFRDAEIKVVALGLGMVALSLVLGVARLIARINANRK